MAEFVTTHRGGKALHYQGYIYTKIRDGKEGITFWRCQDHKSGCLARASSEGSSVIVRREHDHPPNNAMCTKERVMSTMRKREHEESTSINRIYDDALQVSNSVMYSAVAFCPPHFVRMAWLAVQQEVPNIPNADELVSYF